MTPLLDVSVVMSVYNGERRLAKTLESVLAQEGVRFEIIAVDDGSSDRSGEILAQLAAGDPRIKVIRQEHQGLTRALICGCEVARGEYIARQDAGDISLPGRLAEQTSYLQDHPDTVLVTCGTRYVGPAGEHLYDVASARASVMFRRSAYEEVGGYRGEFYFAQDVDLELRLSEKGQCAVIPRALYQVSFTVDSLSARYRQEQMRMVDLILRCARLRAQGRSEASALRKAREIGGRGATRESGGIRRAQAFYFIGRCLEGRDPMASHRYYRRALGEFPLHLRSWWRLVVRRVGTGAAGF